MKVGAIASLALAIACGSSSEPASVPVVASSARALEGDLVCIGTDTHTVHVNSRIPCSACHPAGGEIGFSDVFSYTRGTSTEGGTIVRGSGDVPTSCSVACHSPLGAPPHSVTWGTPGPLDCTACHDTTTLPGVHPPVSPTATRADCVVCHETANHTNGTVAIARHVDGWMDPASASFHPYAANRGLASCAACHAADLTGGTTGIACSQCHDEPAPGGGTLSWTTNCTMCHGGTDNATGAPPKGIWGNASDAIRVGAHTRHVESTIAPAMDCGLCHLKPANAFSAGHIDTVAADEEPMASVEFSGIASAGVSPTWNRATTTCSSTYCHGATVGGGTNKTPDWTRVDGSQASCGTCHGVPPPSPHPVVTGGLTACSPCHQLTVDASGAIIPPASGGKHLNGSLEATGHELTWMDRTSSNFHAYAANRGLESCQGCHGPNLEGGSAPTSCVRCHTTTWRTNCTMCHGGTDNASGAPPRTVWGASADTLRVGAHTRHGTQSATSRAFGCGECHVNPVDAFSASHISVDDFATVTFSALATGTAMPSWDRTAGTCSTYCHGSTLPGGTNKTPRWLGGPSQATCGTCHPAAPTSAKHWHIADGFAECADCHGMSYWSGSGFVMDRIRHVNGVKDIGGAISVWDGRYCTNACHGGTRKLWQ